MEKKKGRYRNAAKFWLEPQIELETKGNLTNKEINEVMKIIKMNKERLVKQLEKFYNGMEIKTIRIK